MLDQNYLVNYKYVWKCHSERTCSTPVSSVDCQDQVSSSRALPPHQAHSGALIITDRRDYPATCCSCTIKSPPIPLSSYPAPAYIIPSGPGRFSQSDRESTGRVFPASEAVTVGPEGGQSRCEVGEGARVHTARLASF